ncbi:MAG TPA: TraR/DksA C4-type zinc finger protein [Candidatus Binatia bacterium]|nr:TraR/DksA C4-type zinc finger protein [Candidatus Binatia bacterium]
MDARTRAELAQVLRGQRAALLKQFFDAEADLRSIAEDREPELEERAQEERAARVLAGLDDRSLREIAAIHGALQRMIDRTYGRCLGCGRPIPLARLRAVPTAAFCVECARQEEIAPTAPSAPEPRHPGRLPADLDRLFDREVEEALRELVREDRRVDMEELRIVCRHGIVHLEGAVPSEAEHQILGKLVTDVGGCEDVVDHLQVNELLWERPERSRPVPREGARPGRLGPVGTEDVVESVEEGLEYLPPDRPPPEEE